MRDQLLERIEAVVGPQGLLSGKRLAGRSAGIWSGRDLEALALVRPASTDEVAEVMKLCHAAGQVVEGVSFQSSDPKVVRVEDDPLSVSAKRKVLSDFDAVVSWWRRDRHRRICCADRGYEQLGSNHAVDFRPVANL